jgi:hypothetical protein
MAMMAGSLYEALLLANVPKEAAQRAAVEAASFESQLTKIESGLFVLKCVVAVNTILTLMLVIATTHLLGVHP